MKADNEALAVRLQKDLPIKGQPLAWLDAHKTEVQKLLKDEGMGAITKLTGLVSATIHKWLRKVEAKPLPPKQEASVEADVSYWRGRAEAFHEALTLLAAGRV